MELIQKVNNDPNLNFLANRIYHFASDIREGEKKALTLICTEVDSIDSYIESIHECVLVTLYAFPPEISRSYHVEIKVRDKNVILVCFSRDPLQKIEKIEENDD